MKTKLAFSAGGIIFNKKGQILMIEDAFGRWTFPKGLIDKGETPEQAAVREVKEEVGVDAEIIKRLTKDDYWYVAKWEKEKPRVHKTVYWFLMKAEGSPKPQTSEITNARWLDPKQIAKLETYVNTQKILKKALATLGNPKN